MQNRGEAGFLHAPLVFLRLRFQRIIQPAELQAHVVEPVCAREILARLAGGLDPAAGEILSADAIQSGIARQIHAGVCAARVAVVEGEGG